jgi:hypothetical protein
VQPLTQKVSGQLYRKEEQTALLLAPPGQEQEASSALFLRYALVMQGTERHIFPSLLLDDWGKERDTIGLYRWIFEQGQRFPRAEIFGFDHLGRKTQVFLRDLEIFFKYPCYIAPARNASIADSERLHVIFLPEPGRQGAPQEVEAPEQITWPLRHSAVQWRQANARTLQEYGWEPATLNDG